MLLASPTYFDCLLDNALKLGVKECYDGVKLVAGKLNTYFKEKYKNQKRLIAIMLNGYELEQKHLGNIPNLLKQNGFNIVYIIPFSSRWVEGLENKVKNNCEDYIFAEFEFLESLDFFPLLIEQADAIKVNQNIKSLKLFTSMEQLCDIIFFSDEYLQAQDLSFYWSSYINIHFEGIYNEVLQRQKFCNIFPNPSPRLIKGGYPSIDRQSETLIDFNVKRDTVIFAHLPVDNNNQRFKRLITDLLENGFRVMLKAVTPHFECAEEESNFSKHFMHYPNFMYYTEPRLSKEEQERAITIIAQATSMGYSFPALCKRPSILLYPSRSLIPSDKLQRDTYYNDKLHIRIFEEEDAKFIDIVRRLANDKQYQQEWRSKIEDFCQNDIYHYGNASAYLANWIMDWYDRREILVTQS